MPEVQFLVFFEKKLSEEKKQNFFHKLQNFNFGKWRNNFTVTHTAIFLTGAIRHFPPQILLRQNKKFSFASCQLDLSLFLTL